MAFKLCEKVEYTSSNSKKRIDKKLILKFLTLIYIIVSTNMAFIQNKPKSKFVKSSHGLDEYILDNGLKILLKQDPNAPLISFQVWYRVGSRNELGNETGIAHYLEHMMFKGTKNFKKGEIAQAIQLKGGIFNAFTSYDYTAYYENFAPENLELAIKIESDRMRNSRLSQKEIDLERSVIISELEGGENYPSTLLGNQLRATAFQKHPYHNPIIGWKNDLFNINEELMKKFYDKYYAPNNSFIMLAGNFDKELALDLIDKYFGPYKANKTTHHQIADEPKQKESRRTTLYYPGQIQLLSLAFHIPEFSHPDLKALNIIDELLFNGTTSRLYKKLVDTGLAVDVNGYAESNRDPALYKIVINLSPEADVTEIEKIVNAELEDIKTNLSKEELAIARARVESSEIYQRDGVYDEALQIAYFEVITGDWEKYFTWYEDLKKIKASDIKKIAKKYFKPDNKTVAVLLPEKASDSLSSTKPKKSKSPEGDKQFYGSAVVEPLDSAKLERLLEITAPKYSKNKINTNYELDLKELKLDKYPNTRLVYKKDESLPLVFMKMSLFAGSSLDGSKPGLAYMVSEMLDRGTKSKDKFKIAEILELLGAEIEFETGRETTSIEVSSLKKNLNKVMSLFTEMISEPAFSEIELEKLKKELIETAKQQDEYPSRLAKRELMKMIYPKDHVYYSYNTVEKVKAIESVTITDIKNFYKSHYALESLNISTVGDLSETEARSLISKYLSAWDRKIEVIRPSTKKVNLKEPKKKHILKESKQQSEAFIGHVGEISRNNPDFYPLFIANFILGGSPLSSKLGTKVRDENGLVYNIRSSFSSGITPGPFYITLGANPENVEKAINLAKETVAEFLKTGITETELKATKSFLTGSFAVRNLSSNDDIAEVAKQILVYDLDLDYPENYSEIINSISLDQVNAAARKYIHPEKFSVVIVGPSAQK